MLSGEERLYQQPARSSDFFHTFRVSKNDEERLYKSLREEVRREIEREESFDGTYKRWIE